MLLTTGAARVVELTPGAARAGSNGRVIVVDHDCVVLALVAILEQVVDAIHFRSTLARFLLTARQPYQISSFYTKTNYTKPHLPLPTSNLTILTTLTPNSNKLYTKYYTFISNLTILTTITLTSSKLSATNHKINLHETLNNTP